MSYKTRNILILSIFLFVVVSTGGYFLFISLPGKINSVRKSIRVTDQKIAALSGIELELKEAQKELAEQQKKLSRVDKQLVSSVAPAETYKYLNSILRYSGVLKFDLTYAGKREAEGYGYDIYHLKGEGFFSTLFKFIWYLERGPKIFKIRRANFRGVENRELDSTRTNIVVPFEVEFWALYTDVKDVPSIHRSLRDVKFSYVRNPYLPYIYRNLPLNKDGLVEVERARLKGILPGKAFVEDHTGKVHTLEEGAKVYLGFVSKIDHKYNEVYFILNKGGIIHQYKLKLGFD